MIAGTGHLRMIQSMDGNSPLTDSVSRIPLVPIGRPNVRISKSLRSMVNEPVEERTVGQATAPPLNSLSVPNKATSHWQGQNDIYIWPWSLHYGKNILYGDVEFKREIHGASGQPSTMQNRISYYARELNLF